MNITVNGEPVRLYEPTSVRELLATRPPLAEASVPAGGTPTPLGKAVAVNGTVVPASAHTTTLLAEGDDVEIVTAVAGG